MKIIEHGIAPDARTYTLRCHNCNTKFEFNRIETEFVADQREGDFLRIKCPVCNRPCTHNV